MNHDAIYALYPTVVTIDDGTGAFDTNGNQVEINLDAVNSWVNPKEYQRQRAIEYPSIGDQLDALWKGGAAAEEMLAKVQAVKTKYPKE